MACSAGKASSRRYATTWAARAAWKYSEDSSRYLFGDSLGNGIVDAILAMLRRAHPNAVSRTAINKFLGGKVSKKDIDRALRVLLMHDLAEVMVAN